MWRDLSIHFDRSSHVPRLFKRKAQEQTSQEIPACYKTSQFEFLEGSGRKMAKVGRIKILVQFVFNLLKRRYSNGKI